MIGVPDARHSDAPPPWTKRSATSIGPLVAAPQAAVATAKTVRPPMNTRFGPATSVQRPAGSRKTVEVMM